MTEQDTLSNIPTNIITGFLGAGKTSAILHLLKSKPENERWAVLVNEFGEIGVDGSLFEGQHTNEQGVFIKEVPGGCMCCAAGLPMQIALTSLLALARPDRLLIEPTGLGHPVEVLGVLAGESFQKYLSIEQIITLVDARHVSDARYTDHDTFNQQLSIADVIVGNKSDLYGISDKESLAGYLNSKGFGDKKLLFAEQGQLDISLLAGPSDALSPHAHHHHYAEDKGPSLADMPIPESGFVKAQNEGEGFQSVGWRFKPQTLFDRDRLYVFLNGLAVERLKGVFITKEGIYGYNLTPDALTEVPLDDSFESRIEIISDKIDADWEEKLMACIV